MRSWDAVLVAGAITGGAEGPIPLHRRNLGAEQALGPLHLLPRQLGHPAGDSPLTAVAAGTRGSSEHVYKMSAH